MPLAAIIGRGCVGEATQQPGIGHWNSACARAHQAMKPIRAHGKALPEQMHVSGLIGAPKIPRELVEAVRRSVIIDWTVGTTFVLSSVLSSSVSCASTAIRPIRQESATQTVLEQAGVLSANWAVA